MSFDLNKAINSGLSMCAKSLGKLDTRITVSLRRTIVCAYICASIDTYQANLYLLSIVIKSFFQKSNK